MSCDEHVAQNDSTTVESSFGSALKDNEVVKGYVTIIKNEGKEDEQVLCRNKPNLLTNGGRDYAIAQFYTNTSAGGVGCNFIALTSDSSGKLSISFELIEVIEGDNPSMNKFLFAANEPAAPGEASERSAGLPAASRIVELFKTRALSLE